VGKQLCPAKKREEAFEMSPPAAAPILLYGSFKIENAPIAIVGDTATTTPGSGNLDLLNNRSSFLVKSRQVGEKFSVTAGTAPNEWVVQDPTNPSRRGLFVFPNREELVTDLADGWTGVRIASLDSEGVFLDAATCWINSGGPSPHSIAVGLKDSLLKIRIGSNQTSAFLVGSPFPRGNLDQLNAEFGTSLSRTNIIRWMLLKNNIWTLFVRIQAEDQTSARLLAKSGLFAIDLAHKSVVQITVPRNFHGPTQLKYDSSAISISNPDITQTTRINDLLAFDLQDSSTFLAPITSLIVDSSGAVGEFCNVALLNTIPAPFGKVQRIEDLNRYHYIDEAGADPEIAKEFAFRPIHGSVHITHAAEALVDSVYPPLAAGEHRMVFDGEIQHLRLLERSNGPLRVFGSQIEFRHDNLPTRGLYFAAVLRPSRSVIADTIRTYTTTPVRDSSRPPALNFGDLSLHMAGNAEAIVSSARFPDGAKADKWRFPIREIGKTPLKGDSKGLRVPTFGQEVDPRNEVYVPLGANVAEKTFNARGSLKETKIAGVKRGGSNLLGGFGVRSDPPSGTNQPENCALQFGPKHILERSTDKDVSVPEIRIAARNGSVLAPEQYRDIDVTLEFPSLESHSSAEPGSPSKPRLRWQEKDVNRSNSDVRRLWSTNSPSDWSQLIANNSPIFLENTIEPASAVTLDLREGWKVALNAVPPKDAAPTTVFFDACRNQSTKFSTLDRQPANGHVTKIAIRTTNPKDEDWVAVGEWWRPILETPPSDGHTQALSPLDPLWSGVVTTQPALVAPESLPLSFRAILSALQLKVAWWDGQGATAVCDHDIDFNDPKESYTWAQLKSEGPDRFVREKVSEIVANPGKYQLVLGKAKLLIVHNQIRILDLLFRWQIPFFDVKEDGNARSQWVEIDGRWEKSPTGVEELAFEATLPNSRIDVGFLGIDWIDVSRIRIARSEGPAKDKWSVDLDGQMEFDDNAESHDHKVSIRDWFSERLKSLSFTGLSFDLNNPLDGDWQFPKLAISTQLDLLPKGFKFDLRGFKFEKPPLTPDSRCFRFFGDLHFAIPNLNFVPVPVVRLDLVFTWQKSSGLGIRFDNVGFGGVSFRLFNFIWIDIEANWNDTEDRFEGKADVRWTWKTSSAANEAHAAFFFVFGAKQKNDPKKFWVVALEAFREQHAGKSRFLPPQKTFDLGFMTAESVWLLAGHRATREGLRSAILAQSADDVKKALVEGGLADWHYTDDYDWFFGAHIEKMSISGVPALEGKSVTVIFCDDSIFRIELDLGAVGLEFTKMMLAVDWKRGRIGGSIGLPKLYYGAYEVELGQVGFIIGDDLFQFDWGYPFNFDWSRSIKVKWNPPPWPIPINSVDGGVLAQVSFKNPFSFTTSVAVRMGFEETFGADAGSFGAYVKGEAKIGGMVVSTFAPPAIVETGIITVDLSAKGGLTVFGLHWDILSVEVHAHALLTVALRTDSFSTSMYFEADFSASFQVCLTPCTCIGGTIGFHYSFGKVSQPTNWPLAPALSEPAKSGISTRLDLDRLTPAQSILIGLRSLHSTLSIRNEN
jgi:hypothetical protein